MCPEEAALLSNLQYFYSTLPQVLGAILAITGAFVVFKIDSLKADLPGSSQWFIDMWLRRSDTNLSEMAQKAMPEPTFQKFKFSQMANDLDTMEDITYEGLKVIHDLITSTKKTNKYQVEIRDTCVQIILRKKRIDTFIYRTKITYIVNAVIIALLLAGFFVFRTGTINIEKYRLLLAIGWILTAFSLGWLVRYLIKSISKIHHDNAEIDMAKMLNRWNKRRTLTGIDL